MLPIRSSALSGHIKLWFLTLAVLVVLAQTSPGNQAVVRRGKGVPHYPLGKRELLRSAEREPYCACVFGTGSSVVVELLGESVRL